jgi:hypothetical protein
MPILFLHLIIIGIDHFVARFEHVHEVFVGFQCKVILMYDVFLAGFACFCNPCYTAKLIDRTGDNFWTGWFNPCSLMALRTKVRTTFRIRVNKGT